jgi:hypothetical protein
MVLCGEPSQLSFNLGLTRMRDIGVVLELSQQRS